MHPGKILKSDFLGPFQIRQHRLALLIDVPPQRIHEIIYGLRGITADTALRLEAFFHVDASFWMTLQAEYELARARLKFSAPTEEIEQFWLSDEADFEE